MRGDSVANPHPAIIMFNLCESMKWTHLPSAGGIYDQDPDLLKMFREIFQARAIHQAEEDRKSKMKKPSRR